MIEGIFQPKATMDELSDLHNKVAKTLKQNLDDPKVLALAVKFLKDNNIVTDIVTSDDYMTLTKSIKEIASKEHKVLDTEDLMSILEGDF